MKYCIIEHDGKVHQIIDKTGKPNKYGDPKTFDSMSDARLWILKHTYKGMSHSYEVKGVKD